VGSQFSAENLQYLKKGLDRTKVTINDYYTKSHTRFRLVKKLTTLDDLERPLRTLFQNACILGGSHENLNEDRRITLSGNPKVYADFRVGSLAGGVKRQWGCRKRQFSVLSLSISSE